MCPGVALSQLRFHSSRLNARTLLPSLLVHRAETRCVSLHGPVRSYSRDSHLTRHVGLLEQSKERLRLHTLKQRLSNAQTCEMLTFGSKEECLKHFSSPATTYYNNQVTSVSNCKGKKHCIEPTDFRLERCWRIKSPHSFAIRLDHTQSLLPWYAQDGGILWTAMETVDAAANHLCMTMRICAYSLPFAS